MAAPAGLEGHADVSGADKREADEDEDVSEEFHQLENDSQADFCKRCAVFVKEYSKRR